MSPYITFKDNAREAMEFYAQALGGEVDALMTFADMPADDKAGIPEPMQQLTAHIAVRFGDNILMASDHPWGDPPPPAGFSVQTEWPTVAQARAAFEKIGEGGEVQMPFGPTSWAKGFGMVRDRFGVSWIFNCAGEDR